MPVLPTPPEILGSVFSLFDPLRHRSVVVGLVLGLAGSIGLGQTADAQRFRTYQLTELDGLPSASVLDVDQTPDGRMWFVTRAGVAWHDGVTWGIPDGGTPLQRPFRLAADGAGRVHCSSEHVSEGVAVLEDGVWTRLPDPPIDDTTRVHDLEVVDASGGTQGPTRLYIATAGQGLLVWEGSAWERVGEADGLPSEDTLCLDRSGTTVYVGTAKGYVPVSGRRVGTSVAVPPGAVVGLDVDRVDGVERLWLRGENWLGHVTDGTWHPILSRLPSTPLLEGPWHLAGNGRGGLYVGRWQDLYLLEPGETRLRELEASDGIVGGGASGLHHDRDGNVWVTTLRGVTRIPPRLFDNYDRSQGLFADEVTLVLESPPGRIVLGQTGGLSLFEDGLLRTLSLEDQGEWSGIRILDGCVDREGSLWFAGDHRPEVLRVDRDDRVARVRTAGGSIAVSVATDAAGRVIVATRGGLHRFEGEAFVPLESPLLDSLAPRRILCLGDRLAIASSRTGVWIQDDVGWRNVVSVDPRSAREANDVYAIHETLGGDVLVGTLAGLHAVRGDRLERHGPPELAGRPVYGIAPDGAGGLWLGTDRGAVHWSEAGVRWYTVHEGLGGQETNRAALLVDSRGRAWIGTERGVSMHRPENERMHAPPALHVRRLVASGDDVAFDSDVSLERRRDDLSFEVGGTSFLGDARVRYRYRLEGGEGDWSEERRTGDGPITFDNLAPGSYRLQLQSRAPFGEWGPVVDSPSIRIRRPVWSHWWVHLGGVLLIVFIAVVATKVLASRSNTRNLRRLVRERTSALEESERRYREIFEGNQAVQLILDADGGEVLDANPAACRFYRSPVEELRGRALENLIRMTPSEAARHLASIGRQEGLRFLFAAQDVFGRHVEVHASQHELHDRPVLQATVHDVSERTLLREELQQSQKLRAVGELAGGIAHDFNNLLTAILGFSSHALDGTPPEDPRHEALEEIRKAGVRGVRLVEQLLAFGKRQVLHKGVHELNEIIGDSAGLLRRLLGEDIEIDLRLHSETGRVFGNRSQLERVLINLALNARDAMPFGGTLVLETAPARLLEGLAPERVRSGRSTHVSLTVADTGMGMSPATKSRIFEPFFTTKEAGSGTGLGLSTVYGIVRQYSGEVVVDSAPERGTSISIYLPRTDRPVEREWVEPPSAEAEAGGRVLLVEDDEAVRRFATLVLRELGYEVSEAANGRAALELDLAPGDVDLLLTDVVMPGMSGPELAQRLRQRHPELRVLFMSGYSERGGNGRVGDLSGELLEKPFTRRQLDGRIRDTLADRPAQALAELPPDSSTESNGVAEGLEHEADEAIEPLNTRTEEIG